MREIDDPLLFSTPPVTHLARRSDPATSKAAAAGVQDRISRLQREVLGAFVAYGPMTDERLLSLGRFEGFADSTIRTRRSELADRGYLDVAGEEKNRRGHRVQVFRVTDVGRAALT